MKNILLLIIICLHSTLFAQQVNLEQNRYTIKLPEGEIAFKVDTNQVAIKFQEYISIQELKSFFKSLNLFQAFDTSWILPYPKISIAKFDNSKSKSSWQNKIKLIQNNKLVEYAAPVLIYKNNQEQILYNLFYVKLKSNSDFPSLKKLAASLNFTIEKEYEKNIYFCRTNKQSKGNSFEIARYLQGLHKFIFVEPDFIYNCKFETNDPYYSSQWALNNTGQFGGTSGADIDIVNAWGVTTGSPSIKVAILDCFGSASQFTHPDISFLSTHDATGVGFVTNGYSSEAHGINCAGIIAAHGNNSLGTVGVAYNSKVIAVKIGTINSTTGNWYSTGNSISDGITWAYQNADIISNSNTFGGSSSLIDNAISNSISLGRSGLGTPFFSSNGNNGSTTLGYPASNANTIAVAATSMCDERKSSSSCDGENWGSDYGTGTDIGAPGVHIYTTDISGNAGYTTGDYNEYFNGTSSACPMAAGVMALILSVNPSLSYTNARKILESTCEKVGGYTYNPGVSGQPNGTWSYNLGYGRINAYQAVLAASCNNHPANDNCNGAIHLSDNTLCSYTSGTVDCATDDGFPTLPTCNSSLTQFGVFYYFVAQSNNATIQVNPTTTSSAGLDAVVVLYTGTNCFSLNEVPGGCMDNNNAGVSETITVNGLTSGQTYWIRIYDWGSSQPPIGNGGFQVCVTHTGGCTNYASTPSSASYNSYANSGTFTVSTSGANCLYSVASNCAWVNNVVAGTGGIVTYKVDANNTCSSRQCTISVYDGIGIIQPSATYTVNQTGLTPPSAVSVNGGGTSCNSAILTASGGTGGTIYWQGTTSNGTSTATPSISQTVTSSGTYYFRAYNSCGWGQQGSAIVTINTTVGVISVNGGGLSCNSAILTASGGTGGTIYWQGTTSNGTSTATPSISQTVTSSGTYYFRAYNSCGWGQQASAIVTISSTVGAVSVNGGGASCNSAILTASGGTGGTIYWQGTTSNGTSTATPSISQTVTSSGTYYFRAYNSCGWGQQGSAIVTISSTVGAVSVNGGGISCNSAILTASGGTGGTIYWQGTTSNGTSTATPSTSQTVTSSGTYYFRAYNGCTWGAQGSATVTINNSPNSVSVNGGGTSCNSVLLTASGGTGGTIYWQGTTSNGTSTATPSTSQTVTSSGTYYFRAYNSCGWGQQGIATVTISTTVGVVSVNGGGIACNSTILTASGGNGGTIYWQGSSNNGTSTATPSTSQTVTSSGTYYFRAYNGCTWGTQGSATVTINNSPNAVSVNGGGTSCNSAILTASGGTGGTIYWQGTTSNGTSTATPSTSQTVTSSGTYYFRAYNSCGWGQQGSTTVSISTTVGAVSVSGGGTFCNSAKLTPSGGSGGTIYWQGTISNGTSTAIPSTSQTVTSSGTYYFRAYNGCTWGVQGSATAIINKVDTTLTVNGFVLTSNAIPATYKWASCPTIQIIPGETGKSFSPSQNGLYAVIVSQNNCIDTSNCYPIIINATGIIVYPNPTKDLAIIKGVGINNDSYEIVLTNTLGQLLDKTQIVVTNSSFQTQFLLSKYSAGVYFLTIKSKSTNQLFKIEKK